MLSIIISPLSGVSKPSGFTCFSFFFIFLLLFQFLMEVLILEKSIYIYIPVYIIGKVVCFDKIE